MKLSRFSSLALAATLAFGTAAAHAKPVQITDVNGRKSTCPPNAWFWAFIIKTTWPSAARTR